jgi:hypothetical protein
MAEMQPPNVEVVPPPNVEVLHPANVEVLPPANAEVLPPANFEVLPGKGKDSKVYLFDQKLYYYEKTLRGTMYMKCIRFVSKGDFKCQGRGYLYNNQVTLTNI